jgi:hypothetical protein
MNARLKARFGADQGFNLIERTTSSTVCTSTP